MERLNNPDLGLDLSSSLLQQKNPQIMGVLNVTPDSFSDGGHFNQVDKAISQAQSMIDAGASIIDVGGESTRPNAAPVSVDEELARVIPVIRGIRENANIAISVDTSKAEVMQLAVEAGANIINDVYALRQPGALEMAAELRVPVCLVHMQAKPETMQNAPCYGNVVDEVNAFFMERLKSCEKIGIAVDSIILDPGFGFGKTLQHNLSLLAHLRAFKAHGCPILVGLSRKSMLGELLDKKADGRVVGSVTAALIAVINGASIVRVHDVAQTSDAFKIYNAVQYGI